MKSSINITWKSEIISLATVLAAIITSVMSYSDLPARVVSHWNFAGEPDGWSSSAMYTFVFPAIIVAMYILFLALPSLDPKKERYAEFAPVYNIFRNMIVIVFFLIYLVSVLVNLGYNIRIDLVVPLIIGVMMIVIGNYMGKIKNNWFIGIKTPWTLSSDNVWQKTHRLGGLMFVLFGLGLIASPFLPRIFSLAVLIIGVFMVAVVPIVASYIFYKNEKK